jgi:ribonucleotide reductase beta subunit family protein with ferritin-like domain
MSELKIRTPTLSFVEHYPQFREMADRQLKVLWFWDEIKLEKDIQDILVNMTESERHGVITVLRLFTLYELFAGADHWCGKMLQRYPRPEIQAMCTVFGSIELGVHQPFYARLNELLNLNTDEFYLSYVKDPILRERIEFVESLVDNNDPSELGQLISTAAFSMIEGAVLYSSFAFLKHFQSQGKNKVVNTVRGINFSAVDENMHSEGGAALFKQHKLELLESERNKGISDNLTEQYLLSRLHDIANKIREHEYRIIDMIFEKGKIDGITDVQLKHFVDSRLNVCLSNLGYDKLYEVKYNPIADWFYNGLNNYQFVDFFSGQGREYQRNWDAERFVW